VLEALRGLLQAYQQGMGPKLDLVTSGAVSSPDDTNLQSTASSMAQRSAQAAKEIKSLIGQSVDQVEVGAQRVREAGSVMADIVSAIESVKDAMTEITQVTHAVSDLDHMTQQNAALVEQSAAAADSLRMQAQGLSQTVSRLKIEA
jgi:methyl-accepting chemotaxis protein